MARNKDFVLALKIKADLQNAVRQIDEVTGGLNQTARAGKKADRGARDAAHGMKKAESAGDKLKGTLGSIAKLMAAAFVVHEIASFARGIVDANEKLYQLSKTAEGLNVSVKFLSGMSEQADDLGINVQQLSVVFGTLNRQLATAKRGSATSRTLFEDFGLDPDKIHSTEDAFLGIADSVEKYGLNAKRAGELTQIFGASGKDIVPILKQGAAAIRGQNDAMAKTGQIITDEDLPRIIELHNATDAIGDSFTALRNNLVIQLAPSFSHIADEFGEFVNDQGPKFVETITEIADKLPEIATALLNVASAAATAASNTVNFVSELAQVLAFQKTGQVMTPAARKNAQTRLEADRKELAAREKAAQAGPVGKINAGSARLRRLVFTWSDSQTRAAWMNTKELRADIDHLTSQLTAYKSAQKEAFDRELSRAASSFIVGVLAGGSAVKPAAGGGSGNGDVDAAGRAKARAAARAKAIKTAQDAAVANKWLTATYNKMLGAIDPVTAANNRYNEVVAKATAAAGAAKQARGANVQAIDDTLRAIKMLAQGARQAALAEIADKDREAWEKLRDSLRTPVEVSVDQAINKLKQLTDLFQRGQSGMTHEQYLDAANRIGKQSVTAAPQYQGLDASVGGIGSELTKNFEAQSNLDKWHQQALAHEQAFQATSEAQKAAHEARMAAIEDKYAKQSAKIQSARGVLALQTASGVFGQLAALQSSHNTKMARIGKAAAIAQAIINTYQSATGAYASLASIPYVGPVLGAAAAAVAIAAGLANVAQIRAQPVGGYATGGAIRGPGTGTSDSIPAMLSNGEYVITAKAAMAYGVGFLDRLNARQVPAYAQGGVVASPADFAGVLPPQVDVPSMPPLPAPASTSGQGGGQKVGVRIINSVDPSFVTDNMASSEGEDVILNTISRNQSRIKQMIG